MAVNLGEITELPARPEPPADTPTEPLPLPGETVQSRQYGIAVVADTLLGGGRLVLFSNGDERSYAVKEWDAAFVPVEKASDFEARAGALHRVMPQTMVVRHTRYGLGEVVEILESGARTVHFQDGSERHFDPAPWHPPGRAAAGAAPVKQAVAGEDLRAEFINKGGAALITTLATSPHPLVNAVAVKAMEEVAGLERLHEMLLDDGIVHKLLEMLEGADGTIRSCTKALSVLCRGVQVQKALGRDKAITRLVQLRNATDIEVAHWAPNPSPNPKFLNPDPSRSRAGHNIISYNIM